MFIKLISYKLYVLKIQKCFKNKKVKTKIKNKSSLYVLRCIKRILYLGCNVVRKAEKIELGFKSEALMIVL